MQQTIIDGVTMNVYKDLKFGYSKPKANNYGGKAVYTTKKVHIITPEMITWGAEDFKEVGEETGNGKFKLSLQFSNPEDEDNETRASENTRFLNNMKELEEKIKKDIVANSKEWWGKEKSASLIDEQFKPFLIYPKTNDLPDYDRPPSFNLKLPKIYGTEEFKIEVYDEDENRLFPNPDDKTVDPLKYIVKLSKCQAMFTYNGLLLSGGNIFPLLSLVQVQVSKHAATVEGKCHLRMKKKQNADVVAATYIADSDNEEVESDEDELAVGRKRKMSVSVQDPDPVAAAAGTADVAVANPDAESEPVAVANPDAEADMDVAAAASEPSLKKKRVVKKKEVPVASEA